jgi:GTP-binding protein
VFVDHANITIRAGNGGNGAVSFRREKFEPKGGPNGGNGGNGGNVVFVTEDGMTTLYDFRFQRLWAAKDGDAGGRKQCSGLTGEDLIIPVPPGTLIYNRETNELMHDMKPGDTIVVAKGGKGGWGNEHFKSSTYQTPRSAELGEPGQEFNVRLELKLIADVGIVGKPNAGKSTLLAALTAATPKIANYPFTTLSPQLGVAEVDVTRRIVLADIPGLIEGASEGAGLGHEFLRHIEPGSSSTCSTSCQKMAAIPSRTTASSGLNWLAIRKHWPRSANWSCSTSSTSSPMRPNAMKRSRT